LTISFDVTTPVDPCNAAESGNLDTDGDGISDQCDEDDDNDGILDIDERNTINCNTLPTPSFASANGPFSYNGSNPAIPGVGDQFIYNDVYTGVDAIVTIVSSTDTSINVLDVPGIGVDALGIDTNFQPRIQHANSTSFTEFRIDFVVADSNNTAPPASYVLTTIDNDVNEFVTYIDGTTGDLFVDTPNQLELYNNLPANAGGFSQGYISDGSVIDGIGTSGTEAQVTAVYSLISSVSFRFGDSSSNLSYHSIGFAPCITDNWNNNAIILYENIDTDGDSIPNHLDSDSDNDGCSDADEAYYTGLTNPDADADDNGYYGTGTPTNPTEVSNNGRVIAAGYTTPNAYYLDASVNTCNDNDNDGVPDGADLDDDNDGILDTVEINLNCPSTDYIDLGATFTNTTTGTNGGNSSGTTSNLQVQMEGILPVLHLTFTHLKE